MDVPDNPTDPKEVELTRVDKKTPPEKKKPGQLIINVNITFCTHVGWDGVLVMLFSLGIAGLFVYITFLYTKKFQAWHRSGVWVFIVFAVLYTLLNLQNLFTWKKIAKTHSIKGEEKKKSAFIVIRYKNMFNLNGVFFLWKLYFCCSSP